MLTFWQNGVFAVPKIRIVLDFFSVWPENDNISKGIIDHVTLY